MYRRELGLLALSSLVPSVAWADPPIYRFGLRLHVGVDDEGRPALDDEALRAWVAEASAPFDGAGIAFEAADIQRLEPGSSILHTIRDRHALRRFLAPRRIDVFVMEAILDPHPSEATRRAAAAQDFEPSGRLAGAHIPARNHRPGTFLIVRGRSSPTTLSHELGHFFGSGHHGDPSNIMSYGRTRERFSEHQLRVFRQRARRYLRRGELRALT